jgi:poly(3-hydroxybutyrate) depolymerase
MNKLLLSLIVVVLLSLQTGCAVTQPRGVGQYSLVQEPVTKSWYHLYLPADYVKNNERQSKKWPLVMTFHGMKPYDSAHSQEREWEEQADIYGYIVCAPELRTCDSFMEFPLTREHRYVLDDKRDVVAIMDHIFATTAADARRVLSTSWSCGGYMAHYFANRLPTRFSCVATRLSNFSSKLMLEETVPLYRDRVPVALFMSDGDFPACKHESQQAAAWYQARGFRVRARMIDDMGHQRIPQTAAAFFAAQNGMEPLDPAKAAEALSALVMSEYNPPAELIASFAPTSGSSPSETRRQTQLARTLSNQ